MFEIDNFQRKIETINKDISEQRNLAFRDLATWEKYQLGLERLKPWIEQADSQVSMIGSKPTTLSESIEKLHHAKIFEKQCEEYLPQIQELSHLRQQISGKTIPPNEIDAVHTRWSSIHDTVVQRTAKLDKLVSSWNAFECDAEEFDRWLNQSRTTYNSTFIHQTLDVSELENNLSNLKELNKIISDRQAQLISLTQASDHVSQGLTLEGATNLKSRVAEMKIRVGKLADTVRHDINLISDALLARQEFHMKITDFENWMEQLETRITEISKASVDNVDTNLQIIHALLQEHLEKQSNLQVIYEEIKRLTLEGTPEVGKSLNDVYTNLVNKYKFLEDNLHLKKRDLEKWCELLNWYNESDAQLSHTKYELEARKPNIDNLKKLMIELQTALSKISIWKNDHAPMIDNSLGGIQMRDINEKPLTASTLLHKLESKAFTLHNAVTKLHDKLITLDARWDNLKKIQQKLSEQIIQTQTNLQHITMNIDTCDELARSVEKIDNLISAYQQLKHDQDNLHSEGDDLIKDDHKATTNVQMIITSVDANWEKVDELLKEHRNKYVEMNSDWRDYGTAQKQLTKLIEDLQTMQQSFTDAPNEVVDANVALEKHKRALEILKRGQQHLDTMERKAQQLTKVVSLMPYFKVESIENDLSKIRSQYQAICTIITEKTQSFEAQVIIWKQIEEAQHELNHWLNEMNESLSSACNSLIDAEHGQTILNKYREELPSYQLISQGISVKVMQLNEMSHNMPIPTLQSTENLLKDQFIIVEELAEQLESLTWNVNENEKSIKQILKKSSDKISKIREDVIKCDDLTGENVQILTRIKRCQQLQQEIEECSKDLNIIGERIVESSKVYPAIERSNLSKELQSLQLRRDGVFNHTEKVNATLVAFLTKLYYDKFNALQRMVTTHNDKVLWCEPEQSSDRYNLEVKMASLIDIESGIKDCESKKIDIDNSLLLLETLEGDETLTLLKLERDKVAEEFMSLKSRYIKIKSTLQHNIALWQRYESIFENVMAWLKEIEMKIRSENSTLVILSCIEEKILEIENDQKCVNDYKKDMVALTQLGQDILEVSPESRVAQYVGHMNTRYSAIQKFVSHHLDKLHELKDARDKYKIEVGELEKWIDGAEKVLKCFDEMTGPKAITFYQSRLNHLNDFNESREQGQSIFNKVAELGEALFSQTTSDQREIIRAELRNLRNRMDALADKANIIHKKIECDMMHRSSFEDKYLQVKQWLIDAEVKLKNTQNLLPTLQQKKLALHSLKALAQDVSAHTNILDQLQNRITDVTDDEASDLLKNVIEGYNKLSTNIEDRIGVIEKHVTNHEAYCQTFDRARDWLDAIIKQVAPLVEDLGLERVDTAKYKITQLEDLFERTKNEGTRIFDDCNQQLNIILEQTCITGHSILINKFDERKKLWQDVLAQCELTKDKSNKLFDEWTELEKAIESLEVWTKQIEFRVKDQTLKNTEESKHDYLSSLKRLKDEIAEKAIDANAIIVKCQGVHADSELAARISRLSTKYQAIKNQAQEAVARYEEFVKEHNTFNEKYKKFFNWIKQVQAELCKHSEIVGDLTILQCRQKCIRDLVDTKTKKNPYFESIIDSGEKLYLHTSPDGREIIRQQLRNLRNQWDEFTEDLQSAMQKLDQCLTQFAEFSLSQEQLTGWLREVEKDMHQHTELKSCLEEKRAQLQNHKIMHQEIMSHYTLVESVCDKAQRLVDQTKDTSLNVYLQSIKQLFQNIVVKSQDLLENLSDCVDKHNQFNLQCKKFEDWLTREREKLIDCNDLTGERCEISKRLSTLAILRHGHTNGVEQLMKLKEFVVIIMKNTAPTGISIVKKEIDMLSNIFQQYFTEIEAIEIKQNVALQKWQNFEDELEVHTKWFRYMETAFRDQQLQATLIEKENQLLLFKEKRDIILKKEHEIDEFIDKSHSLLNSSGVERIKPLISQISNRYQLLHVLSKDVVNRCQNIVDEQRAFDESLVGIDVWLTPLEQTLEDLKIERVSDGDADLEVKESRLKLLLGERDQGESRLAMIYVAGEKILQTSSAQGREIVRQELRGIRDRWNNLAEGILEQQKKQDAQSLQWSSLQETLQQTSIWLDNMERAMKQDSATSWASLEECRSKLTKSKTWHQEILAYKRIVETISEKATSLIQITRMPINITHAVNSVSMRYEQLINDSQKSINHMEGLVDFLQQYYDLQKAYQEYQKQQWEKLSNCTDYTGNKVTLQTRLKKLIVIQDGQSGGEHELDVIEKHVRLSCPNTPSRIKESMERDVTNFRYSCN